MVNTSYKTSRNNHQNSNHKKQKDNNKNADKNDIENGNNDDNTNSDDNSKNRKCLLHLFWGVSFRAIDTGSSNTV